MRSVRIVLTFFTLLGIGIGAPGPVLAQAVSGQAVIKVSSPGSARSLMHRSALVFIDSIPELNVYLVEFGGESTVDSVVDSLRRSPNVIYAEPNNICRLPNVQQVSIGFPDQDRPIFTLGEEPPSFYEQPGLYHVGVDSAHQLASGSGVVVAVLDNGVKLDHPLLISSNVLPGYDFLNDDADPGEEAGYLLGHGTFVSGLVLLTSPGCSLLPVRVMSGEGIGNEFCISKALVWTAAQGARVANLSFGSDARSNLMSDAVAYVTEVGMVLVASVGNDASARPIYPAAMEQTIAIGAIDTTEVLATFSSFGKHLTLVAPGVGIYGPLAGEYEWGTWSGTSFSAPLVTGTVALMLQLAPDLTSVQVADQLARTARIDLLWGTIELPDARYGAGVLNAFAAVNQLGLGDIDESGYTDRTDLDLLTRFIQNGRFPVGASADFNRADVNCDGRVNMSDLTILSAMVSGSPAARRAGRCPE